MTKMTAQQAAWLARHQRQGYVMSKHFVAADGRMSVKVSGTLYIIDQNGRPS